MRGVLARSALLPVMLVFALFSLPTAPDRDAQRLTSDVERQCSAVLPDMDRTKVLEEVQAAHSWNVLLPSDLAAIDRTFYTVDQTLSMVDSWAALIIWVAHEFGIPPELLAGMMAAEIELDYDWVSALVDAVLQTSLGDLLGDLLNYPIVMGAGIANVHLDHLIPTLAMLGPELSRSKFYQSYFNVMMTRSQADRIRLATRYRVIDLANAAAMCRYYAILRMGGRPLTTMTVTDMAFVWSAYRGGVVGTPADPKRDHRWSLVYFQKADNPYVLGDTLVALPYFSYYREMYQAIPDASRAKSDDPSRPG